jgi:hypothetical protein
LRQPAALVAVQTIEKRCTIGVCQKKVPGRQHFGFLLSLDDAYHDGATAL